MSSLLKYFSYGAVAIGLMLAALGIAVVPGLVFIAVGVSAHGCAKVIDLCSDYQEQVEVNRFVNKQNEVQAQPSLPQSKKQNTSSHSLIVKSSLLDPVVINAEQVFRINEPYTQGARRFGRTSFTAPVYTPVGYGPRNLIGSRSSMFPRDPIPNTLQGTSNVESRVSSSKSRVQANNQRGGGNY